MESGEAESLSLSGLDGAGNPTPRPRDSSHDIPVWEQQMMTFPIAFSSLSTMLTLLSRSQGDTRDNVQASDDSWEVRKADRAVRQTKSTVKMQVDRAEPVIWGRELGQDRQEHPHSLP